MKKIQPPTFQTHDLDQHINELVEQLRSDIEVYEIIKKTIQPSLKVVRENISKFIAFQEDFHYCKNCPGLNKCTKATPFLQLQLVEEDGVIERTFTPCQLVLNRIEIDSKYLYSDFPSEWKDANIKILDKTKERNLVLQIFRDHVNEKSNRWLFVKGPYRIGKSFLMAALLNDFFAIKKEQVAFLDSALRIKELTDLSFHNKEAFNKKIVELGHASLVVFDDFGNEYKNDFVRDTIVLPLLLERFKNKRITYFTSDFSIDEIVKMYETSPTAKIRAQQLSRLLKDATKGEIDLSGVVIYE